MMGKTTYLKIYNYNAEDRFKILGNTTAADIAVFLR